MSGTTSETLGRAQRLVSLGKWLPTPHALRRLAERGILIQDVIAGTESAQVVEDYPDDPRGPSVLVHLKDRDGLPIHAHWGIGHGQEYVSLVTVYRPDPEEWLDDHITRRKNEK